ncbi:hypothetical protein [Streptomyces chryseus]
MTKQRITTGLALVTGLAPLFFGLNFCEEVGRGWEMPDGRLVPLTDEDQASST